MAGLKEPASSFNEMVNTGNMRKSKVIVFSYFLNPKYNFT